MKIRIWSALIAIYIVWGSTYLAIRFAVETLPPFLMAAVRFLIAGAVLYAWRRLRGDPAPTKVEWRSAAIIGLFLLLGGNGCVVWAEQRIVSGVAALLVGTVPVWMVLIESIHPSGPRPGWITITGIILGFAGITVLISPWQMAENGYTLDLMGSLAVLLAALLWSVGSLYSREAPLPESPLLGTSMEMLVGGGALLLLGTLTGEWSRLDLASVTPRSLWGLIYLIVFGALVGFVAYTWLLRVAPTPLVATYAYVNPLVAILIGNLLAQEPLTVQIVLSALTIVSSVFLINTTRGATGQHKTTKYIASAARKD